MVGSERYQLLLDRLRSYSPVEAVDFVMGGAEASGLRRLVNEAEPAPCGRVETRLDGLGEEGHSGPLASCHGSTNLLPQVPKPMRDAAELLRRNPPVERSKEEIEHALDDLEAPYGVRIQNMIRDATPAKTPSSRRRPRWTWCESSGSNRLRRRILCLETISTSCAGWR